MGQETMCSGASQLEGSKPALAVFARNVLVQRGLVGKKEAACWASYSGMHPAHAHTIADLENQGPHPLPLLPTSLQKTSHLATSTRGHSLNTAKKKTSTGQGTSMNHLCKVNRGPERYRSDQSPGLMGRCSIMILLCLLLKISQETATGASQHRAT